jgi:excisionase family DNA binding protein
MISATPEVSPVSHESKQIRRRTRADSYLKRLFQKRVKPEWREHSVAALADLSAPKADLPTRLVRTADAARMLGVSQWTLRRLKDEGKIKFVPGKFLRFDIEDLEAYIESKKESVL